MLFDDLVGREFLFYGVDNLQFKLDDTVWEVVEDPDDGYRSCLGSVEVISSNGIFFREPITIVQVTAEDDVDCTGYRLVDENHHTWLRFGTDDSDSYYPCFYFNYQPISFKIPPPTKVEAKNPQLNIDIDSFDQLFYTRDS